MSVHLRTWPSRLLARPWLAAFVPINAATSGFGVTLPLLILITLRGAWVDVAVAATLFNVAVVISSMFWGHLADRYPQRRLFLTLNFGGFAFLYLLFAFASNLWVLFALYVAVGFLAPAGGNAANLLILEKFSENERATAFASFQEMSMIGSMAGLLVGYFWLLGQRPLGPLLFLLSALAVVSVAAAHFGIRDPERTLKTAHVAHAPEGLASRLRTSSAWRIVFPFFPARPRFSLSGFARFRQWVRAELHHELPLLLAAGVLFNLSANLFNISYTPYLYSVGIGAASIFLVNFANNFAQSVAFPFSGGLNSRLGADRLVHRSTYARSLGYLATAGLTFVPILSVGLAFGINAVLFGILGAAIAFYSTSSSMILFRALEGRDRGRVIGLNSALGGLAAIGGAALSGVVSIFGSYRLVFLVSAGALLASIPIWTAAHMAYLSRRRAEPAAEVPEAVRREAPATAAETG